MCGRFALFHDELSLQNAYSFAPTWALTERYNIAPSQLIPVQTAAHQGTFMHWGLLAKFMKSPTGEFQPLINARAETLLEKPTFREAALKRRGIVYCSGYYEWRTVGRKKQPYFIRHITQAPMAIAAIYNAPLVGTDLGEYPSVALLTMPAQPSIATLHPRQPVLLDGPNAQKWLNHSWNKDTLADWLHQYQSPFGLTTQAVSTLVNNPQNDTSSCIMPLS